MASFFQPVTYIVVRPLWIDALGCSEHATLLCGSYRNLDWESRRGEVVDAEIHFVSPQAVVMVCYSMLLTFSFFLPLSLCLPFFFLSQSQRNGRSHRGRSQQGGKSLKADLRVPDGSTAGQLHRGVHQEPNGAVSTTTNPNTHSHTDKHGLGKKKSPPFT